MRAGIKRMDKPTGGIAEEGEETRP